MKLSNSVQYDRWVCLQLGRYGHKARMQAFSAGVQALGGRVVDNLQDDPATVRAMIARHQPRFAFTCGMHWTERNARAALKEAGIPLIVLDLGYFRRAKHARDRTGYNQVGLEGLCWVPPADVPDDRWKVLGIADALPPATGRPKTLLVLGQCANDSQHHQTARQLHEFFAVRADAFRAHGWRIVYRPHPESRNETGADWADDIQTNTTTTLAQAIASSGHALTYNSTAGLDVILAGVPLICHESAHYAHIALYGCGMATRDQVTQHLSRLAYSQWLCSEIEAGEPFKFLNQFAPLIPSV